MKRFIYWPGFSCFAVLVLFIAWVVNKGFGTGFWITAGIIAFAILVNGIVATIEDERPGGFNNPNSSTSGRKTKT